MLNSSSRPAPASPEGNNKSAPKPPVIISGGAPKKSDGGRSFSYVSDPAPSVETSKTPETMGELAPQTDPQRLAIALLKKLFQAGIIKETPSHEVTPPLKEKSLKLIDDLVVYFKKAEKAQVFALMDEHLNVGIKKQGDKVERIKKGFLTQELISSAFARLLQEKNIRETPEYMIVVDNYKERFPGITAASPTGKMSLDEAMEILALDLGHSPSASIAFKEKDPATGKVLRHGKTPLKEGNFDGFLGAVFGDKNPESSHYEGKADALKERHLIVTSHIVMSNLASRIYEEYKRSDRTYQEILVQKRKADAEKAKREAMEAAKREEEERNRKMVGKPAEELAAKLRKVAPEDAQIVLDSMTDKDLQQAAKKPDGGNHFRQYLSDILAGKMRDPEKARTLTQDVFSSMRFLLQSIDKWTPELWVIFRNKMGAAGFRLDDTWYNKWASFITGKQHVLKLEAQMVLEEKEVTVEDMLSDEEKAKRKQQGWKMMDRTKDPYWQNVYEELRKQKSVPKSEMQVIDGMQKMPSHVETILKICGASLPEIIEGEFYELINITNRIKFIRDGLFMLAEKYPEAKEHIKNFAMQFEVVLLRLAARLEVHKMQTFSWAMDQEKPQGGNGKPAQAPLHIQETNQPHHMKVLYGIQQSSKHLDTVIALAGGKLQTLPAEVQMKFHAHVSQARAITAITTGFIKDMEQFPEHAEAAQKCAVDIEKVLMGLAARLQANRGQSFDWAIAQEGAPQAGNGNSNTIVNPIANYGRYTG